MEDDEGWKKRVEVNIEAIAPLDIFSKTARWLDQVFIAHHLQQRKDHKHRQLTITNLNRIDTFIFPVSLCHSVFD